MSNAVYLLTGGTSGIGREAAPRLAERGATVVITGRNRTAGETVARAVTAAHPDATGRFLRVDFADFDAVRDLARTVHADYDRLDALCNNASLSSDDRRLVDGVERTMAVNHLAPFLLTACLAPLLRASAPARVVTTASGIHHRGDLSDLDGVFAGREYDGLGAYADSKLANVLFTWELAERLANDGVAAAAFHPGFVPATGLFRDAALPVRGFIRAVALVARVAALGPLERPATAGAALSALVGETDLTPGAPVYVDRRAPANPAPAAENESLRERLWERSADLVGVSPAVPAGDPLS